MLFQPYGPFNLPRRDGAVDRQRKKAFWDDVALGNPTLPGAVGCYVFAMRAGKGFTPWYVGKTEKQTFKAETWQPGKLLLYGETIRAYKGSPVLFLIAKCTPKGKFTRPTTRKLNSVSQLEELLIGTCLLRNRKLLNKRTIKYLRLLHVPGYFNEKPGKRSKNASSLADLLGT